MAENTVITTTPAVVRCCTYTQPASHKPVTFTFAHTAVHSFDSAALNPLNADRGLWRMWGKLIRGNEQSNSIQREAADVWDSICGPYLKVCWH